MLETVPLRSEGATYRLGKKYLQVISSKGPVSRKYKELLQFKNKQTTQLKMSKGID